MINIPIWLFVLILLAASPVILVLLIVAFTIILCPIWMIMGLKSAKLADEQLGIGEGVYNGGENDGD
jgi:hypothetical protein